MTIRSVTPTVPIFATRPTSLRPRSSNIRCSASSLGSDSRSAASASSSSRLAPRGRVPRDRPDRHGAVPQPHQDFRARPDDRESVQLQEIHERGGVGAAQRPVERERWQREGQAEAFGTTRSGRCLPRRCTPWPSRPSRDSPGGSCSRPAPAARWPTRAGPWACWRLFSRPDVASDSGVDGGPPGAGGVDARGRADRRDERDDVLDRIRRSP